MRCVAIVPARGGSKGVPGKNIRRVGGLPLVGRSVLAAAAARSVDRVVVSTDDDAIGAEAIRFGAEVIRRPADLSGDRASSESAILHVLDALAARGEEPDVVAFLQCTSPFTSAADVDAVLAPVLAGAACAFSAVEDHGFLWSIDDAGHAVGVNHDHTLPRKRRQDLRPAFRETGAVYAFKVPAFRRAGSRFCGPAVLVPIEAPPLEIDTPADLALVRAIAPLQHGPVLPALAGCRALVTDFDGVHTDDRVIVGEDGAEAVRCSRRDGLGLSRLRDTGFPILILSKERNPVVARRGEKLRVETIQGCDDKLPAMLAWLAARGLEAEDAVYVGNDVNDLACLQAAGFAVAPSDAVPAVLAAADFVTESPGGFGAVREICDLILLARTPAAG